MRHVTRTNRSSPSRVRFLNHDESPSQVAERLHPGVYIRSFYFYDPDGIMLEFACWTKEFNADEANASPRTAADRHRRPIGGTH